MRLEQSTVPVRVARDGGWVPVDLSLITEGGWLVPAASAAPVRFSAGGTDVMSQTQTSSGEWVSETWPKGVLPTPTVEGDTATYAEVMPGVDLKLVATKTGMASIYVVKSAEAAMASGMSRLQVGVDGAELTSPDDGRVKAETDAGSSLIAAQPLWWDSSGGGTYREPGAETVPAPVTHSLAADELTLDVGATVAAGEKSASTPVQYPIFVDPDWSVGPGAAWYTDAAYPDASYLTAGASDVLRVGIFEQYRSNMFYQFSIAGLQGKQVLSAALNTYQVATATCDMHAIDSHLFGVWHDAGFTWNQEQYWYSTGQAGIWPAMQSWVGPNCGDPGSGGMPVGWGVTTAVQQRVNDGWYDMQFVFTPHDSYSPSRRWFSRAATLIVTYNSVPNVPIGAVFTSPARSCGTSANPVTVSNAGPIAVQLNASDPDAGNVSTLFVAINVANPSVRVWENQTPQMAQGVQSASIPANTLADGLYAWDAKSIDSGGLESNWFGRCYFVVDSTKPQLPTVATTASSFRVGSPVSVQLAGAADVAGYVYWVTPTPLTSSAPAVPVDGTVNTAAALPDCNGRVTASVRWACGTGTSAVTITVAPTDSLSTLWVSAYDKAGNQSAVRGLPLYQSTGSQAADADVDAGHMWQVSTLSSPLPSVIADSNPWAGANGISLQLPSGSVNSTDTVFPPLTGPVLKTGPLALGSDQIVGSKVPVNATNSFTWSMWVKATSMPSGQDQLVAVQTAGAGRGQVQLKATKDNTYSFCITGAPAADDNGRPVSSCATGGSLTIGSWQLVTGIWDAGNQQLRLLIGTSVVPVAATGHVLGSGDWSANGALILGPAPEAGRFAGFIADPAFLPGVVDFNQLSQLATQGLPFSS